MGRFKMKGFSGLVNKARVKKAKRLIRKNVGDTTVDSPTYNPNLPNKKFKKAEKKIIKADKLLKKAGYNLEQREGAGGAEGYKAAIEFATKKK